MRWIPLSVPIFNGMPVYKDLEEKRPYLENTRSFVRHGMCENTLHLPLHTGTHVDYPLHMIPGGKTSSDYQRFPASFRGRVVDLSAQKPPFIAMEHLRDLELSEVEAVFFKTLKMPSKVFDPEFPWLEKTAAAWLSQQGLGFVGIDQPGIERAQPGHETHIALLASDTLIIEGLDLSPLEDGIYDFMAFTLGIRDAEAEPLAVYTVV